MSPDLRELLLRLNLDLADNTVAPERVVWLACDLLVAGLDSPALRELAGESPVRLAKREADALVEQVLVELGVTLMSEEDGVYWALAQYDTNPEPFLGYAREYLRLAEEQLTGS
ncbi:hypothetical protein ACWGE0_08835 [Lentzea sp. NPDC054927]